MKKCIAFALAALMLLSQAVCADALKEYRAFLDETHIFTVEYDPSVYTIDTQSAADENTPESIWFFSLESDDYFIDCNMEYEAELSDFSLYLADEDEIMDYARFLCDAYKDSNCEYVETHSVTAVNGAKSARLPFIILHMRDEEYGETYYAETVSHGYCIYFEIYDQYIARPNADKKQALMSLINTFTPIP